MPDHDPGHRPGHARSEETGSGNGRVGDTIHGEVEVTSVRPTSKGNRGIVVSKIEIKNQHGEVVIAYEATRMLAGQGKGA